MAPRTLISQLPPPLQSELHQLFIQNQMTCIELSNWLDSKGFFVCKSSVSNYKRDFDARLDILRLSHDFAAAYRDQMGEDDGVKASVASEIAQDVLLNLMLRLHKQSQGLEEMEDLAEGDEEMSKKLDGRLDKVSSLISKTSRALSDVTRSDVMLKKYASEVREKAESKFVGIAEEARKRGIDQAFVDYVRGDILRLL
jgi:Protein of unknown function (DUF3486)